MSRTLIDISRLGTDTTGPAVAVQVTGYLQNWITTANTQVNQHQLRIATAPNPLATATDPCGWRLETTLAQLTPAGAQALLLLEYMVTGTAVQVLPGIGNSEAWLGSETSSGWIYPSRDHSYSSGTWSTTPLPFNAQVGWSLAPGAEYFVFGYSQHRFTNRQALPLLIARDQLSGHWILAAAPPSSTSDVLRAVSWNARSGQPAAARNLYRDPQTSMLRINRPAELVLTTSDWSSFQGAEVPPYRWQPLLLPPDFAAVNVLSAAQSYYKGADGSEWLALGGHRLLLLSKEATATPAGAAP